MKPPKLSLQPDEAVRTGLMRIVAALVRTAAARVAHPAADRGEDLHVVRTTIKRLRSLLRLMRPGIGELDFLLLNARLRDAARRLCVARESSVARRTLAALDGTVRRARDHDALAAALAGFPAETSAADETEMELRQVAAELQQIGTDIQDLHLAAQGWKTIARGLRATYAQGRRRMHAAFRDGDDLAFHRWRIRVKNLYYQMEMLALVCPRPSVKMIVRLRKLEDTLGDAHDLAVLKATLETKPEAFGGAESVARVVRLLDKRSAKLRCASAPLGRAIYRRKPRQFTRELHQAWPKALKK